MIKDNSEITNDLHIGRGMVVRFKTNDVNNPKVVVIMITCYVTPTVDKPMEEYESSISRIRRCFSQSCRNYVLKNSELILDKRICDMVFTSGNLKKGYNKSVTMSLFVRQKGDIKWAKLKKGLRNGLSDVVNEMTEAIKKEDFTCKKEKKKIK